MEKMELKREEFAADGVGKIQVDADSATVTVKMWERPQLCVEAELERGTEYESAIRGGIFQVSCRRKKMKNSIFGMRNESGSARVTIFLPREKRYQEVQFSIGAGKLYMSEAAPDCDRISIAVGAGIVEAGTALAKERMDLEVGAGDVKLGNVRTPELNVRSGVGHFHISGKVSRILNVNNATGGGEIVLEGNEADYLCDVSCGVGNVRVNGNHISGMGGEYKGGSPDAPGRIHVSNGVGEVEIQIR